MMIKITHLLMVFALFGVSKTYALQPPWTFTPSSVSHNIFLSEENTPTIGGFIPLDSGAYIGVFFLDDEQQFQNAGFTQWRGTDTFITAYGDDGTTEGFQSNEEFHFRIWRPFEACEVVEFEVEYLTGGIYTSMGRFEPNGISGISSLAGIPSQVAYFDTAMCKNDTINLPSFSTLIEPFTFSSSEGLVIDRNTGAIDPSQSDPGTYLIGVNSNVCLAFGFAASEITVSVGALPDVDLPDTISGCETVSISFRDGGGNSYAWSTGDTTDELVTSESGMYTVRITNAERCSVEEAVNVIVSPPIDVENTRFDTRFVPCQTAGRLFVDPGSVQGGIPPFTFKAENVDGTLLTSANGVFEGVPEGDYFIIFEDSIGCASEISGFEFRNEQSCETAVLTPNNDGSLESLFIEERGLAQVFDRNGIVRKELAIPAYWDGRSDAGDVLPMGTYLIVVNGRKKMTVTIVR